MSQEQPTETPFSQRTLAGIAVPDLLIWLGLILTTLAVYAQVAHFDFVNFDDDLYVGANAHVKAGLTPAGMLWTLTAVASANWQPVTLLSLMLDVQLFGVSPGMIHLMNMAYHALAAMLLFALLRRATGNRGASAFVAFIFALHPLHVESVAWIAERKDVLSTFFFFLALYAYVRYAEQPGVRRYLYVLGIFSLGLMSKPMLVTFPFVLLLFDLWPLRRAQTPRIVWEKIPLFALSAAASVIAYEVQLRNGAVAEAIPIDGRVAKALLSYITYVRQTLWPAKLAVFYPYPKYIQATQAAASLILLLGVCAVVIYNRKTRPYLATGWFWYLGTLVPVIGLVKVGQQSHADRYVYIPMVGLLIMLAWSAREVLDRWPRTKPAITVTAVASCALCLVLAWRQTSYWQNSETLYEHAIAVTSGNWLAEGNLGAYLNKIPDRRQDAMDHLETALRIKPIYPEAENNLGMALMGIELCPAAIPHFEAALRDQPDLIQAHNNLALCLTRSGNYGAAIAHIAEALRLKPDFPEARFNLALTLSKMPGHEQEAVQQYEAALRLSPDNVFGHRYFGQLLANLGRIQEAISQLEAAQRLQPDPETPAIIERLRAGRQ